MVLKFFFTDCTWNPANDCYLPKKIKNADQILNILTDREKEVALLVLEKLPYSVISEKLNISIRTVKAHTKNIYEKFNVSNRLAFILRFS